MSNEFVSHAEFERFKAEIAHWFTTMGAGVDAFRKDVSHQLAHLVDDEWDCGDKECPYNLSGEPDFEEDAGLSGGD